MIQACKLTKTRRQDVACWIVSDFRIMPKCVGLPDGPCPGQRNDSTVKLGEGDLFLCKSCDQERFRQFLASRPATSSAATADIPDQPAKKPARPTRRSPASTSSTTDTKVDTTDVVNATDHNEICIPPSVRSDSTTTTSTTTTTAATTTADVTAATVVTAATQQQQTSTKSRRKGKTDIIKCTGEKCVNDTMATEVPRPEDCSVCLQKCSRFLSCSICNGIYDQNCSTLPSTIFDTVLSIVQYTGWVCTDCRNKFQSVVKQLQIAQAKTVEDLAAISDAVSKLQHEVRAVRQQHDTWPALPTQPIGNSPELHVHQSKTVVDNNQKVSTVALEVHRTISDMTRRKCNIIVTGMPESDNSNNDDESAFLKL